VCTILGYRPARIARRPSFCPFSTVVVGRYFCQTVLRDFHRQIFLFSWKLLFVRRTVSAQLQIYGELLINQLSRWFRRFFFCTHCAVDSWIPSQCLMLVRIDLAQILYCGVWCTEVCALRNE
jgi:hypothetical protein